MHLIGRALRESARSSKRAPALIASGDEPALCYGQLESLAERILETVGGKRGATVAIHSQDRLTQGSLVAAGLMAGCVVCPVNPGATERVLAMLLGHAAPAVMLCDGELPEALTATSQRHVATREILGSLPSEPNGDLPASDSGGLLVYTSGTTGDPKGVLLGESHIAANVAFAIEHFGYDADWTTASVLPLFHTFTVISDLLPMLVCGGRTVITPGFAMSGIKETSAAFCDHEVRSYSAVPIIFDTLVAMRASLPPSLRFSVAGAAPLTDQTRARYAKAFGHEIIPCYGLSETTCFAAASSLNDIRPGAVGKPAKIEIAVFDDSGATVSTGENGEIAMRGASVISQGYFKDGGKHAAAFTDSGWFKSGDIGHFDDDGFLYITGRKKNMLIRGGEKVYLEDVDRCLSTHPAVADCCTVQVASGKHEDRAVAFIVWNGPEVEKKLIVDFVCEALGPLSRPDEIATAGEIPRSPSGKALREVLRAEYEASR